MFKVTLFDDTVPPRAIESRRLAATLLRIGRDPSSDWVIEDPERTISRHHLEVRLGEPLLVRVTGKNFVHAGVAQRRIAQGEETCVDLHEPITIGPYHIKVEKCSVNPPAEQLHGSSSHEAKGNNTALLLEAFCEGAQIDPSHFIAEDPTEILREAGAVYRELILGLSHLMRQRGTFRSELVADRTSIGASENDLIKWAPPHRLAVDLLTKKQQGFLAGSKAVFASLRDLEAHIASLLAGHRSALHSLLDVLRPTALERRTPHRLLRDHVGESWKTFLEAHAKLEGEVLNGSQGVVHEAFAEGYGQGARRDVKHHV